MNIKSPSYILKRCLIPVIIMIIFAAIVVALNNTTKVQIVSREGQTFEKGIVTEIIQDNLQPDTPSRAAACRCPYDIWSF